MENRLVPTTVTNLFDAGPGSLRQALLDTPSGDVVDFANGLSGTIVLTSAQLTVDRDITIQGPADYGITVSGNNARRVFYVPSGRTVSIGRLNIVNGRGARSPTGTFGGGILNEGHLDLVACVVRDNELREVFSGRVLGGGISNSGTMLLLYTIVSNNAAIGQTGTTVVIPSSGGGIYNSGTLTVEQSIIAGNVSSSSSARSGGGYGGGIHNTGSLMVLRSTLEGNVAAGSATDPRFGGGGIGGGVYNTGLAGIGESTIHGNRAVGRGGWGGGVYNAGQPSYMTILSSTVSGNAAGVPDQSAYGSGGGVNNSGTLHVIGSTLTRNTASGTITAAGGGIYTTRDGMTLRNTIVAQNTGRTSADVHGNVGSLGANLIGDGTLGEGFAATDLVGTVDQLVDPLLGPLDYHGGYTLTHALLPGSPAIDRGDPTNMPKWDQRGDGYARIVGANIDIGAYEYESFGGSPGGAARAPTPAPAWIASSEASVVSVFRVPRRSLDAVFARYDNALFVA